MVAVVVDFYKINHNLFQTIFSLNLQVEREFG